MISEIVGLRANRPRGKSVLNRSKMAPLTSHAAHITVQIFALMNPIFFFVSKSIAHHKNNNDLDGFIYEIVVTLLKGITTERHVRRGFTHK